VIALIARDSINTVSRGSVCDDVVRFVESGFFELLRSIVYIHVNKKRSGIVLFVRFPKKGLMPTSWLLVLEMLIVDAMHELIPNPSATLPYVNVYYIHLKLIKLHCLSVPLFI